MREAPSATARRKYFALAILIVVAGGIGLGCPFCKESLSPTGEAGKLEQPRRTAAGYAASIVLMASTPLLFGAGFALLIKRSGM